MFIDKVKLKLRAGNGGDGLVAFLRAKYVPLGGPSGGDGGRGGDIIFEVDSNKSTLLDLRYSKMIRSEDGGVGKTKKMHGADGKDVIIKVPVGTVVYDEATGAMIADLTKIGQKSIICKGGKGGRDIYYTEIEDEVIESEEILSEEKPEDDIIYTTKQKQMTLQGGRRYVRLHFLQTRERRHPDRHGL